MPSFNIVKRGNNTSFAFKLESTRYKLKKGESFESLENVKSIVAQGQQSWNAADKLVAGYEIGVMTVGGGKYPPIIVLHDTNNHDTNNQGMNIKDLLRLFKNGELAIEVTIETAQEFKELCLAVGTDLEQGKELGLRRVFHSPSFGSIITLANQTMDKVKMADLKGWQNYI